MSTWVSINGNFYPESKIERIPAANVVARDVHLVETIPNHNPRLVLAVFSMCDDENHCPVLPVEEDRYPIIAWQTTYWFDGYRSIVGSGKPITAFTGEFNEKDWGFFVLDLDTETYFREDDVPLTRDQCVNSYKNWRFGGRAA